MVHILSLTLKKRRASKLLLVLADASPSLPAAAGLPDAAGLRPHPQRRDRQQGHQVQAPGGGVHLGALAGADLQGQAPGQPGAAGPQAAQRGAQAEVHLQKGESAVSRAPPALGLSAHSRSDSAQSFARHVVIVVIVLRSKSAVALLWIPSSKIGQFHSLS